MSEQEEGFRTAYGELARYIRIRDGSIINQRIDDKIGCALVYRRELGIKGIRSRTWGWGDLYGISEMLDEQLDTSLISFRGPIEAEGQYFIAFSAAYNNEAEDYFNKVKKRIDSVKFGLGRGREGDSTSWQLLDRNFRAPDEWGLNFPDGDIWILMQKQ